MKKQLLNYGIGILLCLFFASCETEKKPPPSTPTESQLVSSTGIPAIDKITTAILKEPDNPKLYAARAEQFYNNEAFDEAILDMASAMKIDSTNADYHHLLADIYLDYYKSRLALKTMERAANLHPKRIPTLLKLAFLQYTLRFYDSSMGTINKVMALEPQNAEAFFIRGLNFVDKGNKQAAIKNLQTCVDNDPDHIDGWILLGQIYAEDKNPIAAQYFENAIQVDPNSVNALQTKASYLHNNDKLDEAMDLYRKITEIDSKFAEAYQSMGVIYFEKDSVQKAYEHFDLSTKVDPTFVIGYYFRGLAAEAMGNLASAKNDYQNVLNFDPKYDKAIEAMDRVNQLLKK